MKSSFLRSVLFGFMSWVLPLALTFIATPLVVRGLGIEEFGLYALVLGFISYSFTFSVGRAVTKYVAEYKATGQSEKIREVLSATLWLNVIVGAGGALILCFLAPWLVSNVFGIKPEFQEKAVIAFYLAASTVFFLTLSQVFSAVIQAVQRFDVFSYITTAVAVSSVSGNIILVLLGHGLVDLLVWNLLNTTLSCVFFYIAGKKLLPEARWNLYCRRESLLLIAKFTAGIAVYQFLFNFLLLFERGLITGTMGTENLTYYVVPMNITGQIHGFSSSLLLMIFPLASELGATMETERLLSIYKRVSKYIFALVTFIVLSLCVSGHEFFRLWLSLDFADKTYKIVAIQAVTFGIIAVGIVTWQMMEGLGFTNRNAVLTVLWVAVSITAMIILSPILKLEGVGIGRLLGCVLMLIYILIVEKWVFGKPLWSFWLQIGFSLSIAAGFAALLEYAWLKNFSFGWLGFLIGIGFGGIGYLTGLIATRFLNVEERRSLQNTFFRFLPQFSENK